MNNFLQNIKNATKYIALLETKEKNDLLIDMSKAINKDIDLILSENKKDMHNGRKNNLSSALLDRLFLDKNRIISMAKAIEDIAILKEPVGRIIEGWKVPSGLKIEKVTVPIGLIAIIYESRPNVTSDTAALCLKSGNACILKGGSEAENSNKIIAKILQSVLKKHGLPKQLISLISDSSHEAVSKLIKMDKYIDLVIPRGGEGLIKYISQNSTVPVIKHDKGLCHVYIDKFADINKALKVCVNAKCRRTGICGAMETLLVHKDIAKEILPLLQVEFDKKGTQLKGCEKTTKIISIQQANEKDFSTEYLDNILSIKIVENIDEALNHIDTFGSHHSDSIITDNYEMSEIFLNGVDSACVYLNASTQFTDGGEFGFGAEVGISTNKLHARGPMGINELTTYKYKIYGQGNARV